MAHSASREAFITDFGAPIACRGDFASFELPRYGLWEWSSAKAKHQVSAVSNNLTELFKVAGKAVPVHPLPLGAPQPDAGR